MMSEMNSVECFMFNTRNNTRPLKLIYFKAAEF